MRFRFLLPLAALAGILAACGQDPGDPALVEKLRILGVRSEPPEAQPGASVALDALVVDPKGAGRAITWAWALCVPDPLHGVSSCADPARITPLGAGSAQTVTIPANSLDGLDAAAQKVGIDLFAVLLVSAPEVTGVPAHQDQAFKRIRVSTNPSPNSNPHVQSFSVAGAPVDPAAVSQGEKVAVTATAVPGSAESYVNEAGTQTEDMLFTWLMSAGTIEDDLSVGDTQLKGTTAWTAVDGAPPATLWVVLRDGRGGIDWSSRQVVASP